MGGADVLRVPYFGKNKYILIRLRVSSKKLNAVARIERSFALI
jgi:hypothetical protein